MATAAAPAPEPAIPYGVQFRDGTRREVGTEAPAFTFHVRDEGQLKWILSTDAYSAADAFVKGAFEVTGDLIAAVRVQIEGSRDGWRNRLFTVFAALAPWKLADWLWGQSNDAGRIGFHYDRSNVFYRQFLDQRLVYSCAYFRSAADSLERAQVAKFDHVCGKLRLGAGERFLDIGCGWGALVLHAAEEYGAIAVGCTVSAKQYEYAAAQAAARGLGERVLIRRADYRDLGGRFGKIASVGMFEHVGPRQLQAYFDKAWRLLEPGGLFLNHGIVRPEFAGDGPETLFVQRRVFPGARLVRLSDVVRAAELAGFEILDVENLRAHYALTIRMWAENLMRNREACLSVVTPETYRTWLVYLAAATLYFESGLLDAHDVLLARRSPAGPPRTRESLFRP